MSRYNMFLISVSLVLIISGCAMKRTDVYRGAGKNIPTTASETLCLKAEKLFNQAKDKASLEASIAAFEAVLKENPGEYRALVLLSNQYILYGTTYAGKRSEKREYFQKAMTYAELAMYTNPSYRQRIDSGTAPWDAADVLGKREAEAMLFWATALQYDFKECMFLPEKILNVKWLKRCLIFLDRAEEVAPDFGGGTVAFGKVICYYALPKRMGGSKEKGDEYMQKAVSMGDGWLFPRWARGKYYYVIKDEPEKSRQDLKWVSTRDISLYKDPYPWRVHFQQDALSLLN